jgi:hypothetical protein
MAVLKDVAGARILPIRTRSSARGWSRSRARVKVFSIGKIEEGREMIVVAVSSEANLAKLDANRANLAKLADPRTDRSRRRRGGSHIAGRPRFITTPARSTRPKPIPPR